MPHNDVAAVGARSPRADGRRALVLAESIYSVLGDAAPLRRAGRRCARRTARCWSSTRRTGWGSAPAAGARARELGLAGLAARRRDRDAVQGAGQPGRGRARLARGRRAPGQPGPPVHLRHRARPGVGRRPRSPRSRCCAPSPSLPRTVRRRVTGPRRGARAWSRPAGAVLVGADALARGSRSRPRRRRWRRASGSAASARRRCPTASRGCGSPPAPACPTPTGRARPRCSVAGRARSCATASEPDRRRHRAPPPGSARPSRPRRWPLRGRGGGLGHRGEAGADRRRGRRLRDADEVHRLTGCAVQEFTALDEPLAPDTAARRAGRADPAGRRVRRPDPGARRVPRHRGRRGRRRPAGPARRRGRHAARPRRPARRRPLPVDVVVVARRRRSAPSTTPSSRWPRCAARGLEPAGLVIGSWPAEPGLAERCNAEDLPRVTGVPVLATLPEGAGALDRDGVPGRSRRAGSPDRPSSRDVIRSVAPPVPHFA